MTRRRIARGVAANLFDKVAITVTQIAIVPLMATNWGLGVYGCWILLAAIPSFLAISDLGFGVAAGTRMTMLAERGDRAAVVRSFQSALVVTLSSTIAFAGAAVGAAAFVPDSWLPTAAGVGVSDARWALVWLTGYGLVAIQGGIIGAGFRSGGLYATAVNGNAATVLLEFVLLAGVVLIGGGIAWAGAALLIGRIIGLGAQAMLLRRRFPWLAMGFHRAHREEIAHLLTPALAILAFPVAQACFLQGTALALGLAVSVAAVPAFTATRTLSRIGLQAMMVVTHALMPEYARAVARGDRAAQASMQAATVAVAAAVSLPFAVILVVFGQPLVAAWTDGVIRPDRGLLIAMAATVVLGGAWTPISALLLAMNRHMRYSYAFVVGAVATVPMAWALSRWLGAAGAGWAMALLDGAMCVVVWRAGRGLFASTGDTVANGQRSVREISRALRARRSVR